MENFTYIVYGTIVIGFFLASLLEGWVRIYNWVMWSKLTFSRFYGVIGFVCWLVTCFYLCALFIDKGMELIERLIT